MRVQNNRALVPRAPVRSANNARAENEKDRPWGEKGQSSTQFDRVSGNTGLRFMTHFRRHQCDKLIYRVNQQIQ